MKFIGLVGTIQRSTNRQLLQYIQKHLQIKKWVSNLLKSGTLFMNTVNNCQKKYEIVKKIDEADGCQLFLKY